MYFLDIVLYDSLYRKLANKVDNTLMAYEFLCMEIFESILEGKTENRYREFREDNGYCVHEFNFYSHSSYGNSGGIIA